MRASGNGVLRGTGGCALCRCAQRPEGQITSSCQTNSLSRKDNSDPHTNKIQEEEKSPSVRFLLCDSGWLRRTEKKYAAECSIRLALIGGTVTKIGGEGTHINTHTHTSSWPKARFQKMLDVLTEKIVKLSHYSFWIPHLRFVGNQLP